jgi:hypothetical protein
MSHDVHLAKRVITQTARILSSFIPSRIVKYFHPVSPVEDALLEGDGISSDVAMDGLVESHEQWMNELAEEAEYDIEDEDLL